MHLHGKRFNESQEMSTLQMNLLDARIVLLVNAILVMITAGSAIAILQKITKLVVLNTQRVS